MSEQVASRISDLPWQNGKAVMLSGHRPSLRSCLAGSSVECAPATSSARLMTSFMTE